MDCCLQLASHNCFLYISLVDSCFFTILRIYRLNFTSQQIPIWVANTLPWAPEVFLACGGNFRCWPKADTSSVQIPICPSLRKTYFSLRKTYFRQNIDHKQYSPKLYFPFVYLICLLHMLSLTFLFFIIHFYFSMQFLWAWISHGTELRFRNIHLRAKRNLRIAVQTFILEQMALFSVSIRRISASFWSKRIL